MLTDQSLQEQALEALREVLDPELGINVVDLGLVYGVTVADGRVHVLLTMTTAACPLSDQLVQDAEAQLRRLPGIAGVQIELVWEPAWTPERMSGSARRLLGWE